MTRRRFEVIVWSLQISSAYTGICFLWQADIAALEERLHEEEQRAASKVSEAVLQAFCSGTRHCQPFRTEMNYNDKSQHNIMKALKLKC